MSRITFKISERKNSRYKKINFQIMAEPRSGVEQAIDQINHIFREHAGSDHKLQKLELKKLIQSGFALFNVKLIPL